MANPLSRREVLKYGAFTTVGGVLTPGISLAQAITTESRGLTARDIQLQSGGTAIPAYDARPEAAGRYPITGSKSLTFPRGCPILAFLPAISSHPLRASWSRFWAIERSRSLASLTASDSAGCEAARAARW